MKLRRCDEISIIISRNIAKHFETVSIKRNDVFHIYICITLGLSIFVSVCLFLLHSRTFLAPAEYPVLDSTRKYFPIEHLHQRQIYVCVSAIFRKTLYRRDNSSDMAKLAAEYVSSGDTRIACHHNEAICEIDGTT